MVDKVKVQELDPSAQELVSINYKGQANFARFGDVGCIVPVSYKDGADKFRNMAVRADDVWVATFPRSGTTWMQELVWLLMNDFDYDTASKIPLMGRYLFLEIKYASSLNERKDELLDPVLQEKKSKFPTFEAIASAPSPRFIKTHMPFSLLPSKLLDTSKVLYVARDPKDVAVSYYHHNLLIKKYDGDFKSYWNLFINGLVTYGPFFPHLKEAWALRHHPNMLFIFYEDMKEDLPSCIKKIADFLGKEVTNEQVMKLSEHLDINNFKKNESVNQSWMSKLNPSAGSFVRKGVSGGWREHFDEEMAAQAQRWLHENLAGSDLRFPHASTKVKKISIMGDKVKVEELDPSTQELVSSHYKDLSKFARFGDIGCTMSVSYKNVADYFRNMAVRADDVWVATFPRSGTTWTQELVWLLMNNFDYDTASKIPLTDRYFFLEIVQATHMEVLKPKRQDPVVQDEYSKFPTFDAIVNAPSPRFIKTHMPFSLLPSTLVDTAKVVYVARDPRDVAVSKYHHNQLFLNYEGDFKSYWNLFINDLATYCPFFPHLKEAWALRHHPNMLFIFYEEMKEDLPSCIKKIADFLGKEVTNEQVVKLCEHLDIKQFRKNESVNQSWLNQLNPDAEGFVRKGASGGWREHFDEEMAAQAQSWLRVNLAGTNLRFPQASSKVAI